MQIDTSMCDRLSQKGMCSGLRDLCNFRETTEYLGNSTRERHSYYGRLTGNHVACWMAAVY